MNPVVLLSLILLIAALSILTGWMMGKKDQRGINARERRHITEVEGRWRRHNAEARAAGCMCGAPATEVRYDHRNLGSVPVEFWTCAEHVGVQSWWKRGDDANWTPSFERLS